MEIVLGIDNILLVAILSQKVAPRQRERVRRLGIGLALVLRIALLFDADLADGADRGRCSRVLGNEFSGRDLVLLAGGLFLIYKATHELYERIESGDRGRSEGGRAAASRAAFGRRRSSQILALDIVFSLDSVITAVGMARALVVMMAAMMHRRGRDARVRRRGRRLRHPPSEHEGPGPVVPAADRRAAGRRRPSATTSTAATSTSRWRSRWSSS